MNAAGWFIMVVSLALVLSVTVWSYYRLLRSPREEPPAQPPEARTREGGPPAP